jgi:hypothetical protein
MLTTEAMIAEKPEEKSDAGAGMPAAWAAWAVWAAWAA